VALSQSDLMRLSESLRTADGLELVRTLAQRILQELIEAEATARIGAEPGEHADSRTTWRNGHRDRTLTTQAGDLDLAIPKGRTGSFFPALLERRRRIDQALRGHHGGLRPRRLHPVGRRPRGSARTWTNSSPRSAPGRSATPASPTSTWTRPTARRV